MPSPYALQVSGTLAEINIGAAAAIAGLLPLIAQLEAILGAQFGLGALKLDLVAQLQASLQVGLTVQDPTLRLQASLKAALRAVAEIQAALAAGITLPTINLSAKLSLLAALQVRIGGINLLLQAALAIKLAALNLYGQAQAALTVGPVALYTATNQTLADLLNQVSSHDYTDSGLLPGDVVTMVVLVSKAPGFHAGASFLFPMPPA